MKEARHVLISVLVRCSMVIAYLREQLCLLQREGPIDLVPQVQDWPNNEIAGTIPRVSLCRCPIVKVT